MNVTLTKGAELVQEFEIVIQVSLFAPNSGSQGVAVFFCWSLIVSCALVMQSQVIEIGIQRKVCRQFLAHPIKTPKSLCCFRFVVENIWAEDDLASAEGSHVPFVRTEYAGHRVVTEAHIGSLSMVQKSSAT